MLRAKRPILASSSVAVLHAALMHFAEVYSSDALYTVPNLDPHPAVVTLLLASMLTGSQSCLDHSCSRSQANSAADGVFGGRVGETEERAVGA